MKTNRWAAMGIAAALLMSTAQAADAAAPTRTRGAGQLRDLQLPTEQPPNPNVQPTDHATAQVVVVESNGSTTVTLKVQGMDHAAAGTALGAHVHVGPCETGNGTVAGPHYNSTAGSPTVVVNAQTEVWLDFVIGANGQGRAEATVPFIIPAGAAASVVIHQMGTLPDGSAGTRWACLPVPF